MVLYKQISKSIFILTLSVSIMLFMFQQVCFSQDKHLVDSLESQLKKHNAFKIERHLPTSSLYDTAAVKILAALSQSYWGVDAVKAMEYAEQTLSLSEQLKYTKGKGSAYNSMGVIHHIKGDYINAFVFFNKALLANQEVGNKKSIANSYINIGNTYMYQGKYPEALTNFLTALKIKVEVEDKEGIAGSYSNIGIIYRHQANYPEALKNFFASLTIFQEIGNQKGLSGAYNNIGVIYNAQGNYPEALKNYLASLKIREAIGDKHGIVVTRNNIGSVYYKQGNYPEALKYHFSALKSAEEIGANPQIANSFNGIGDVYVKQYKYDDASQYLNKSLALSREIGNLEGIKSAYKSLTALDSAQQNFKQSLEHYRLYITYRDSLVNEENTIKITQQQMQYAFDIKETELNFQQQLTNEQLAKQQFINKQRFQVYILGLIAFLGIIGLLLTRLWYARKKQQLLQRQKEIEQREASRLTELDKLKTNLYTSITHEFRTPLTLILGPVRKLLHQPNKVSTSDMMTNLNLIEQNGKQLLSLVNQILDLQKLEASQLAPQYEQGDVMAFLHYLVDSFQSLVERKNISLEFESYPNAMVMDYDKDKLQKICSNLLANAVKFTQDAGSIKFIAHADDQWLAIDVIDTGIGIPKENLDTIFNLFYQVDNTSTRRQDGTGIGLTLVKELVELLGGKISVDSEPNKGTAFHVRLPVRHESPVSLNQPVHFREEIQQMSNGLVHSTETLSTDINNSMPLILVVEDNPDVARYLGTCLEGIYRIEYAIDGRAGIERAIELIPDIVISDVMMPEADGFEVCRFLKEDPRTSHIPVILLTALSDVRDRLEGLRRGADAYLTKPFYEEELLITIEQLLKLRQILRHRYADLSLIVPGPDGAIHDELVISPSSRPNESFDWPMEDAFMIRLLAVITDHMDDAEFTVEELNKKMGMSNTQLFRKLKALTDLSANQLIRHVRLGRAKELLQHSDLTVAEIAYQTGFTDPSYFTRIFSREVGVTPTEFLK